MQLNLLDDALGNLRRANSKVKKTAAGRYSLTDGGPKKRAIEVRYALFNYFIDIRSAFKVRFSQELLLAKAKELYDEYCKMKTEAGEQAEKLKVTCHKVHKWCREFRISLEHLKKQFSVTHEVRKVSSF